MTALVSDELYFKTLPIAFASLSSLVDYSQLKQMLIAKSEVPIELSVAVDYTVDTLSNTVTETVDTNVENYDDVVSEDNVSEQQPTHSRAVPENTSTGGACKYIGEVWGSNEDDSTNDSCSKFGDEEKFYTESDMNRIHMEYKIKMDKLRNKIDTQKRHLERQLRDERSEFEREKKAIEEGTKSRVQQIESVKKLEQEYLEKRLIREKEDIERKLLHDKEENERKLKECELRYQEELDKQVQLKEEEVEMAKQIQQITFKEKFEIMTRKATKERELLSLKLQNEKKDRDVLENKVETLRQKLEDIQLGHSDDETVSRKRRRVDCLLSMSEDQGISKLESVVVIRLLNGDICTFRRQLKSLAKGLHEHRQDIQDFKFWFLTDNAVKDYNYCKKKISDSMKFVIFKNNHIKTLDNNIEIVAQTLYDHLKSMGTIEADVSVLRRLREDSSAVHATSSLMDSCNENESTKELLSQVYTIVTNLYKELVTKEKSKNESK